MKKAFSEKINCMCSFWHEMSGNVPKTDSTSELTLVRQQLSELRSREQDLLRESNIDVPKGSYNCHLCRTSLVVPLGHLAYPPEPIECPICKEETDPIMVLTCGHFICRECFKGFFVPRPSSTQQNHQTRTGNMIQNGRDDNVTTFTSSAISLIFTDALTDTVSIKFISTWHTTYVYHILDKERWGRILSNIQQEHQQAYFSVGEEINIAICDPSILLLIGRTSAFVNMDDIPAFGVTVFNIARRAGIVG